MHAMAARMISCMQRLALLAIALSVVSGFTVPQTFQKSLFEEGASNSREIFRLARDELVVNSTSSHGDAEGDGCDAAEACWTNSRLSDFIQSIFSFRFADLTESLNENCSQVHDFPCNPDVCPNADILRLIVEAYNTIAGWVCTHQIDFFISYGCWTDDFTERMMECVRPDSNDQARRVDDLRDCFESTVRDLPECYPRDEDFFLSFSNFVLDEQERIFPE